MQYSTFFKMQSAALIDIYQERFTRTIWQAVLWTGISFIITAVISNYSQYDQSVKSIPVSVLSFFSLRFSFNETYSVVDNAKSIFIFFVSIFSISQVGKVTIKNIACLAAILFICCLLDLSFFQLKGQLHHGIDNRYLEKWASAVIYILRLYMPLVLFALTIQICTSGAKFKARNIVFLFITLYFFNEMTFLVISLMRTCVFELLLCLFNSKTSHFIAESILGAGLMASFVIGYHCAMTGPFVLGDDAGEDAEESVEA
jgi:hypothetical protein